MSRLQIYVPPELMARLGVLPERSLSRAAQRGLLEAVIAAEAVRAEPPGRAVRISREQQEELDPVLGEAAGRSPGTADLVMGAYKLGREHSGSDEEAARLRNALMWVRHVSGLHYVGGAFDPEHMRDLANMATAVLQGKALPDYDEVMDRSRVKAAEYAALFASWADDGEGSEGSEDGGGAPAPG
jgi:hypothetical protein